MSHMHSLSRRWLLLVPALGLGLTMAGCQAPGHQADIPAPMPVQDTCNASAHEALIGTSADKVDLSQFPTGTRLLYPTSPMTLDMRPDRLNIHADAQGKIVRLSCN